MDGPRGFGPGSLARSRAGAVPRGVDDGLAVPEDAERTLHVVPDPHEARDVLRGDLDLRGRPVVPDPDLPEPALAEVVLRRLDLSEDLDGDRSAVRDPGGEARVARLVPEREAEAPREGPHVGLREPGVDERVPEPRLVHRPDPGTEISEVGDVDRVRDRREAFAAAAARSLWYDSRWPDSICAVDARTPNKPADFSGFEVRGKVLSPSSKSPGPCRVSSGSSAPRVTRNTTPPRGTSATAGSLSS